MLGAHMTRSQVTRTGGWIGCKESTALLLLPLQGGLDTDHQQQGQVPLWWVACRLQGCLPRPWTISQVQ